ncbi:MAG: hypothetical protein KGZ37_07960 [Nitrosarchaeum sp.]|nr:hypothetical protein [Nitrosarchaeum sp.]
MSEIRVTHSGLISLLFGIFTIPVSLAFMVIVTRSLSTIEYGTYTLIIGILVYATIIEPIVNYWSPREIARDIPSGSSTVFFGGVLSLIGILIYVVTIFFISKNTNASPDVLYFGAIIIAPLFVNRMLSAINTGFKPHIPIITGFVFSLSNLIITGFFMLYLKLDVWILIEIITISYIFSIIILGYCAREKLRTKISFDFPRKWIKLSWIPLFSSLGYFLLTIDISIFSILTGSVIGLAFWGVAIAVSKVGESSSYVTRAIYAKILQGKSEELGNTTELLFYFVILFSSLILVFGKSALFILNPQYEISYVILGILTIQTSFWVFSGHFQYSLTSNEKVDIKSEINWKEYFHSKLIRVPLILLLQSISYLTILSIGFVVMKDSYEFLDMLHFWAITLLLTHIPFAFYFYKLVQKNIKIQLDYFRVLKYFLSSIVSFGTVYVLTNKFLVYDSNPFNFAPNVILFAVFGISCYIGLTYIFDSKIRNLFYNIIHEFKKRK